MMNNEQKKAGKWTAIGVALGCGMGVAVGNIAIGLVLGIVIGFGVGRVETALENKKRAR